MLVRESISFKRGVDPKEAMGVGMNSERKIREVYNILQEMGIPFGDYDKPGILWKLKDLWAITVNNIDNDEWVEIFCSDSDYPKETIIKGWTIGFSRVPIDHPNPKIKNEEEIIEHEPNDINKVVKIILNYLFPNINSEIVITQQKLNILNKAKNFLDK